MSGVLMSIRNKKTSSDNPLFVVTNKGKDIEQAEGFVDALIKKYGLAPMIELLNSLIVLISENLKGHTAVIIMKGLIDDFIDALESLLKMIDPVLAFNFIKR
jgi:hypothetical protein